MPSAGAPLDCERGRMVWRRELWQNDCSDGSDPAGAGLSRAEGILYGIACVSAVRRFLDWICHWNFDCRRGGCPAVCAAFFSPPPQRAAGRMKAGVYWWRMSEHVIKNPVPTPEEMAILLDVPQERVEALRRILLPVDTVDSASVRGIARKRSVSGVAAPAKGGLGAGRKSRSLAKASSR